MHGSVTGAGGLNLTPAPTTRNNVDAGTATRELHVRRRREPQRQQRLEELHDRQGVVDDDGDLRRRPFTYTGSAQTPCSVTVTGAGGLNLAPDPDYATTRTRDGDGELHYAGDANHTGSSDSKNFTIDKASSTTAVTCGAGPFTYTGSAQTPCTVTVTGAGGLSLTPDPDYANNTNAGTATASYTYAGDDEPHGQQRFEELHDRQGGVDDDGDLRWRAVHLYGSAQTPCYG